MPAPKKKRTAESYLTDAEKTLLEHWAENDPKADPEAIARRIIGERIGAAVEHKHAILAELGDDGSSLPDSAPEVPFVDEPAEVTVMS